MDYKACSECDWDATGSPADVSRAYKAHRQTHVLAEQAEAEAEREDSGA